MIPGSTSKGNSSFDVYNAVLARPSRLQALMEPHLLEKNPNHSQPSPAMSPSPSSNSNWEPPHYERRRIWGRFPPKERTQEDWDADLSRRELVEDLPPWHLPAVQKTLTNPSDYSPSCHSRDAWGHIPADDPCSNKSPSPESDLVNGRKDPGRKSPEFDAHCHRHHKIREASSPNERRKTERSPRDMDLNHDYDRNQSSSSNWGPNNGGRYYYFARGKYWYNLGVDESQSDQKRPRT